ncbi:MAG: JAB domain-containing protein [Luteimonas sp.]
MTDASTRSASACHTSHGGVSHRRPQTTCDTDHRVLKAEEQTIAAATEILRRRMMRLGSLADPSSATDFLKMRLAGIEHEVFYVIYLDTQHTVIAAEVAFTGTIDNAEVHPREIVKRTLHFNAAALLCAHNNLP